MSAATGFSPKLFQLRADQFLAHLLEKTGIPGAAVAVSCEGQRAYGFCGRAKIDAEQPLGKHGRFQLGCLMKLIVSVVALELAGRGKLDLLAPISRYLPELKDSVHGRSVSTSHLLSHTSGYRGVNVFDKNVSLMSWSDLVAFIHSTPQHFSPGEVYSYEHTETVLAAEILRRVCDMEVLELLRRELLDPIGVSLQKPCSDVSSEDVGQHALNTQRGKYVRIKLDDLTVNGQRHFSDLWETSFSTLTISIPEMLKIAEFLTGQSMEVDGKLRVAAPITRNLLQRPVVRMPAQFGAHGSELPMESFGLGIARWRNGFYGVAGGVFGQCHGIRFDPARGLAVAVGLNALNPALRNIVIGRVTEDLAGEMLANDSSATISYFPEDEVIGRYAGAGCTMLHLERSHEGLSCRIVDEMRKGEMRFAIKYAHGLGYTLEGATGISFGFLREQAKNKVAIMVGQTAFKKVA